MITYNHEKYIHQAIEGVLMQDCNFDIELILANDCSPDATNNIIQDILTHHPRASKIKYINHETNLGMVNNFIDALSRSQGQYIAMCEGDDYWIDPLKLQKQVDFLDQNKDYSACFTNINKIEKGVLYEGLLQEFNMKDFDSKSIFIDKWIPTLTVLFKKDCLDNPLPKQFSKVYISDTFMFFLLAQNGKIGYLDFVTGVYRRHEGGVWSGSDKFSKIKMSIESYSLIKEHFYKNKTANTFLSDKIIYSKWEEVYFLSKQGKKRQFFIKYLSFVINNPIIAIKKGYSFTKQYLKDKISKK